MAEVLKHSSFIAPRKDTDVEITVKRSRFIGSVRIVLSADEAAETLKGFSVLYPKANHHCWAYRIGTETPLEHCSDAGEPTGTAGRPILGTLKRHTLTNTLVVVTRYFGGIKLGVRGLIEAYGEAAELAVADSGAVEMEMYNSLDLACAYDYSKTLLSTLRKWGFGEERQHVNYGGSVEVRIEVPREVRADISDTLDEMYARGFLTRLIWNDEDFPGEKWR